LPPLALGWNIEGDDPRGPGIQMLHEALDSTALASSVPALEDNNKAAARVTSRGCGHGNTVPRTCDIHSSAGVRPVTEGSSAGVERRELRGGQAHLVTNLFVPGDGQAGRGGSARIDRGELLSGGQAHLITDLPVAGDG